MGEASAANRQAASAAYEGTTDAEADVGTLNSFVDFATNVDSAWNIVKTNKAVSVAILDTGCRVTHEDLKDNIVDTYDATVGNADNHLSGDVKDVTDIGKYGTRCIVAGILITARALTVCPTTPALWQSRCSLRMTSRLMAVLASMLVAAIPMTL